jgi:hypothetical protein
MIPGRQYCDWVKENLVNPTTYYPGVPVNPAPTVFDEIGQCYPGGNQGMRYHSSDTWTVSQSLNLGGNAMVVLEQQSNVFKVSFIRTDSRRLQLT